MEHGRPDGGTQRRLSPRRQGYALHHHGDNVAEYLCFAPLAVAGLRTLPDTLASRAIFIHMRRRAPDEEVESFRLRYHPAEAEPIKMALAEWCQEHEDEIRDMEPAMPFGITDRNADCWEPLLAIADAAGGDWPEQAREAAKYLTGAANDDTITKGIELLQHIKEAFGDKDRLWTSDLIDRLCDRPESPWTDVFRGKAINDRGLAVRLTPYGIKSRDVRIGATKHKGYLVTDFHDAWKRYLPSAATAATAATFLIIKTILSRLSPLSPQTRQKLKLRAKPVTAITGRDAPPVTRRLTASG